MPGILSERLHDIPEVLSLGGRKKNPPCSADNSPEKDPQKRRSKGKNVDSKESVLSPAAQVAAETRDTDSNKHSSKSSLSTSSKSLKPISTDEKSPSPDNGNGTVAAAAAATSPGEASYQDAQSTLSQPTNEAHSTLGDSTARFSTALTNRHLSREQRNQQKWRSYFPHDIEPDEHLVIRYQCALSEAILISGNLFLSNKRLYFSSNLPGLKRRKVLELSSITAVLKQHTFKFADNALSVDTHEDSVTLSSLISRDATYALIMELWQAQAPVANKDFVEAQAAQEAARKHQDASSPEGNAPRMATQCGTEPFAEICLDVRIPTTPEKVYYLVCRDNDFMKQFWEQSQELWDIHIGEWSGEEGHQKREYSYTKPLKTGVGPKSTACQLSDEEMNLDPEEYFEWITVTKTPEVPGGDLFEVRTKFAVSWAGGGKGGSKCLVSTQCDWSGRHMLKGTISKAAVEGQRAYHKALASRMREHIKEHASEFATEDVVDSVNDDELDKGPEVPLHQRFWEGLTDPQDPVKLALAVIVALLFLSNMYLLFSRPVPAGPAKPIVLANESDVTDRLERMELAMEALKGALAHV